MISKDFNSLIDLVKAFPTEQDCINHLERLRWNGYVVSPFDPTSKVYKCKGNKYRCKNTGKYFNVRTSTLFDNTKVDLIKWFMAIWLVISHKKGISSLQLSRDIKVTQKTAWFMLQRIRKCFGCENDDELNNEVEIDETFAGGKNKNRHENKKIENSQGRSVKDKTAILSVVERKGKIASTSVEHITPEVIKNVKNAMVYTNTIEGFWSILKRGIVGIYHFTSRKHIQRYADEFAFRYNIHNHTERVRFNLLLQNTEHRLTYKELIYG